MSSRRGSTAVHTRRPWCSRGQSPSSQEAVSSKASSWAEAGRRGGEVRRPQHAGRAALQGSLLRRTEDPPSLGLSLHRTAGLTPRSATAFPFAPESRRGSWVWRLCGHHLVHAGLTALSGGTRGAVALEGEDRQRRRGGWREGTEESSGRGTREVSQRDRRWQTQVGPMGQCS